MGKYSSSNMIWKVLDEQAAKQPEAIMYFMGVFHG
jgi:hypothetical protein